MDVSSKYIRIYLNGIKIRSTGKTKYERDFVLNNLGVPIHYLLLLKADQVVLAEEITNDKHTSTIVMNEFVRTNIMPTLGLLQGTIFSEIGYKGCEILNDARSINLQNSKNNNPIFISIELVKKRGMYKTSLGFFACPVAFILDEDGHFHIGICPGLTTKFIRQDDVTRDYSLDVIKELYNTNDIKLIHGKKIYAKLYMLDPLADFILNKRRAPQEWLYL